MERCVYHQTENTIDYEFTTALLDAARTEQESYHFHKNFEIITVIEGKCSCSVDGKDYLLSAGEALIVFPFQIHRFGMLAGGRIRHTTLHDHLIWSLASTMAEQKPVTPTFAPKPYVVRFFEAQLADLFGEEQVKFARIPAAQRIMIKGCLYVMGAEFFAQATLVPYQRAETVMIDIVEYIAQNFKRDISLAEIAQARGYSYHYLSRVFNRMFSMGFKAVLNQYRMEYAYFLLQDTDLPIGDIAFESGFQSIRSFDHVCREIYGKSPSLLRKEHYHMH